MLSLSTYLCTVGKCCSLYYEYYHLGLNVFKKEHLFATVSTWKKDSLRFQRRLWNMKDSEQNHSMVSPMDETPHGLKI